MKILAVSQAPLADPGEGDRWFLLMGALRDLGHEVTMMAPGARAPHGITQRTPRAPTPFGRRTEAWLAAKVAKEVLPSPPDVAIVGLTSASYLVPRTLAGLGVPVLLSVSRVFGREIARKRADGPAALFEAERQALRFSLARVRGAVAEDMASKHAAEDHLELSLPPSAFCVIDDPSDLELGLGLNASPDAKTNESLAARRDLGLPETTRVLASVGPLDAAHRIDLLIEAHRTLPGVTLLIAGEGEQAGRIEASQMIARPSSPVVWLATSAPDVQLAAIRAANICINVHGTHAGAISALYAAAAKRQVIFPTEDAGHFASLYDNNNNGDGDSNNDAVHGVFTAAAFDTPALSHALKQAFNAETTAGPLKPLSVQRARTKLGWTRTARATASALERCVCVSFS